MLILSMADAMPVNTISKFVGETDKRLWRIITYYVNRDLKQQGLLKVRQVGADETSTKLGHNYVSLFVDMDTKKVIFVAEGKAKLFSPKAQNSQGKNHHHICGNKTHTAKPGNLSCMDFPFINLIK